MKRKPIKYLFKSDSQTHVLSERQRLKVLAAITNHTANYFLKIDGKRLTLQLVNDIPTIFTSKSAIAITPDGLHLLGDDIRSIQYKNLCSELFKHSSLFTSKATAIECISPLYCESFGNNSIKVVNVEYNWNSDCKLKLFSHTLDSNSLFYSTRLPDLFDLTAPAKMPPEAIKTRIVEAFNAVGYGGISVCNGSKHEGIIVQVEEILCKIKL